MDTVFSAARAEAESTAACAPTTSAKAPAANLRSNLFISDLTTFYTNKKAQFMRTDSPAADLADCTYSSKISITNL
jgi:hypothetical protein